MHFSATRPQFGRVQSEWRSWAEISCSALLKNLEVAAAKSGGDRVMVVVKADAYGHGAGIVAPVLEAAAHSFGVACTEEALHLRQAGVRAPIFLLGPALPAERAAVVAEGFRPILSNLEEAGHFNDLAGGMGVKLPVQLVLDTGMGRVGFDPQTVMAAVPELLELRHLSIESVASHFPSADEEPDFTVRQAEAFRKLVAELVAGGLRPEFVHVANSAGILGYPHAPGELVRAGLMIYGAAPLPDHATILTPALTWKARITLVRDVPAGRSISYGRTYFTDKPTRVATVAAGYADGYPRHISNRGGNVLVQGRRCPILGRVTMDQLMIDVSQLPRPAAPGDECVLLGRQEAGEISARELAVLAGTNEWEIFTRIGPRVHRLAVE